MPRLSLRPYTKSVAFDGSVSSLEKTSPTGINNGTNGSVTVSGWIYLTSESLGTFAELYVSGGTSPAFGVGIAGSYYLFSDRVNVANNKTITQATFQQYIGLNRWVYLTYVLTSTQITVYAGATAILDSVLGTAINCGTLSSIMVGMGRAVAGTLIQPVRGYMKDILFFNGALTGQEVSNLYYSNIRPSSLAASFLMEEGSGSTVADGTGTNSLTGTSITWTSAYLPTQARTALPQPRRSILYTPFSMVGAASTTSGITIPNSASLNPTAAVTVRIRFMKSGPNTYHSLFDNSQTGVTNSYFFDYYEGVGFRWYSVIGGISQTIVGTTYRVPDGVWVDAIATYTGSAIYIYVNGVKLAEEITGISGALGTNSNQLCIGRTWNALAAGAARGAIHRPMIFNVGCTLQEAKDMYFENKFSSALQAGKVLDITTNDGSGVNPVDASSFAHVPTMGAAMSWSAQHTPFKIPFAIRPYSYSLLFNGSSQYVTLGTSGSIAEASSAFTVIAWFKQTAPAAGSIVTIVGDTDIANKRFQFQLLDGKIRSFVSTNGTSANFAGNLSFLPGVWNQVAMTYDGSNARSYINGVLDQTVTCTGVCSASTAGMAIGRGFAAARYMPGNIARLQYGNVRALSQEEIMKTYRAGIDSSDAAIRAALTGEWKLDENTGSTAIDSIGSNNGTITGATYSTDVPFLAKTAI